MSDQLAFTTIETPIGTLTLVASDVGCLVSAHEGLPVFMLECLQLGRPFLGTRVGDLGTVLDDQEPALVHDAWDRYDYLDASSNGLTYVVEGSFGHEDNVGGAFGPLPAGSVEVTVNE